MRKRPPITVLIKFDPPNHASFNEIRNFIILELESAGGNRHPNDSLFHSLNNVHVSKPITAWRDPKRKNKNPMRIITSNPHSS